MSREVRRVPLDYKHPTEFNPYWMDHVQSRQRQGKPHPRLHPFDMRFVGLCDDYPGAVKGWEEDLAKRAEMLATRSGRKWDFQVEYHLTGFRNGGVEDPRIHPFYVDDETPIDVRDEDHLHELLSAETPDERPNPEEYMPVFDVPEEELGWCLYETVSEGTPVTPVFATADELIEHLVTEGTDWGHEQIRRTSAEALVRGGGSVGLLVIADGQVFDSTQDADKIQDIL